MDKRTGQPITFRVADDIAAKLERYVETNPEWTKVEILSVSLHWFLETAQADERLAALTAFRSRRERSAPEPNPTVKKRK
jgi:hypothetical protein